MFSWQIGYRLLKSLGCVFAGLLLCITNATAIAANTETLKMPLMTNTTTTIITAGPLKCELYISRTAHIFHVVDQISEWSEFCHRQYGRYFRNMNGGLSEEDKTVLAKHSELRKKKGWGGGLEQTFYTQLSLEDALKEGIKQKYITADEAELERSVLTHFAPKVDQFLKEQKGDMDRIIEQLVKETGRLREWSERFSRFVGGAEVTVPVYLLISPGGGRGGGGYNGGRLALEVTSEDDGYNTLVHEVFHVFLHTQKAAIQEAAKKGRNFDQETLNEGMAYAVSSLLDNEFVSGTVSQDYQENKRMLQDTYARFNRYGLALRPLMKEALFGNPPKTLTEFLPRAVDIWLAVLELSLPSEKDPWKDHDYKKDPRHSVFLFEPKQMRCSSYQIIEKSVKFTGLHKFGRHHDQYNELTTKAKAGDDIVLAFALDNNDRIPDAYKDLLPREWSSIEKDLKDGKTVQLQGKARGFNVFLYAAPTSDQLRELIQQTYAAGNALEKQTQK